MRKGMEELTKPTLGELVNGTSLEFNKFINTSITTDSQTDSLQTQYDHIDELPFYKRIALRWKIFGFNKKLQYFERIFLHKKGLKGRPWFKHVVYASGRDTGYEGFAFPGLKEALDDSNVEDFYYWTKVLHKIGKKLNKLD
ncbi:uncharacterized protein SCODWIG_03948 [Saccharomycodes ludwigii]|uniref:Transferrin receptor-like dimerisation domain-containing protein n=1 Tax=Saccharomycodes ludwigii TaxID=36035 RepID=A0A376BC47_9ASCO|nr:uncharacterized protein SCODWIG_03948 [Saccharomycodes ludwigii]